jgi:hypothetical protein
MGTITRNFANDIVAKSKSKNPLNVGTQASPISSSQSLDISNTNYVNVHFNENVTLNIENGRFGFAFGTTYFRLINNHPTESKLLTVSTGDGITDGQENYYTAFIQPGSTALLILTRFENRLQDQNFEYPNQSWKSFRIFENDGSSIIKMYENGQFAISLNGQPATVQLPTVALEGMQLSILDADGTAGTHNITIDRNGHNIEGDPSNYVLNASRSSINLVYIDATKGWLIRYLYNL